MKTIKMKSLMLAMIALVGCAFTLTSCDDDDDVVSINKVWFTTGGEYFGDSEADLYYHYFAFDFSNPKEITIGVSLTAAGVKDIGEESGLKLQPGVFYKEGNMKASVTLNPDKVSGVITTFEDGVVGSTIPFKNLTAKSVTLEVNEGEKTRDINLIASKKKIAFVDAPQKEK